MSDNPKELSARFHNAAKITLGFAFVLLIPDAIGCIGFLPINLSALPSTNAIKIVALLLSISAFWGLFEWLTSSEEAQVLQSNKFRLGVVIVACIGSLIITYPRIVEHTRFETVSRLWFVAYPIIGVFLGFVVGTMVLVSSTIRTKEEAAIKHLSRFPSKTVETYLGGGLCFALVLVLYYICLAKTPQELNLLPSIIVGLFFLAVVITSVLLLLPEQHNSELCFVKQTSPFVEGLKKANDFYDSYNCHLEIESNPNKKTEVENAVFMLRVTQMSHSPDDVQIKFHVENPTEFSFKIDSRAIGDLVPILVVSDEKEYPGRFRVRVSTGRFAHFARKYLSEHKSGINEQNETEFHEYMMNQAVLDTARAKCGKSFYESVVIGNITSAKRILSKSNIDINKTYEMNRTALIQAVQYGLTSMVVFLLEKGADPAIVNVNNATPLSYAAMTNNIKVCKLLFQYGAQDDVNKQDIFGSTPVMYAALRGYNDMVKLLMSHGADPNIKCKFGKSAIDIARKFHHGDTVKILIGKRPRVNY